MSIKAKLKTYIKGGYSCIQIVSPEEDRVVASVCDVAIDLGYAVWSWTITDGLSDTTGAKADKTEDPLKALQFFSQVVVDSNKNPTGVNIPNKSIVILRDLHMLLKQPIPHLVRRLKEAIAIGRATNRHLIITGCTLNLPPELEKEITVIEFSMPTRDELKVVAERLAKIGGVELNGNTDAVIDAMAGLTEIEAENAGASSLVETKTLCPEFIAGIKAEQLGKGGLLTVAKTTVSFDDLGGCTEAKSWVSKRKHAFTKKAREYGLPMPKGIIIFGVQGCGKSFMSSAIAHELQCPMLILDAGKLFGGLVGSSEANVRSVINQVEAFGKCVLRIDEIDKGFAGMNSSHDGDSGTTRRVIGTFLTWMQEKTSPVFIIATANDLTRLPPELLRKGRWDELFFIDLPTTAERTEIWNIQIRRHGRKPEGFDAELLSKITDGWTGAEIESLFGESLYTAFDSGGEPTTEMLESLSKNTVPLSQTMGDRIKDLRDWAKGKARRASAPEEKNNIVEEMKRAINFN